jgi:hypothetical protein
MAPHLNRPPRNLSMRKERSQRRSLVLLLVILLAVSLPSSVFFSLEGEASPEIATSDVAVTLPMARVPLNATPWAGAASRSLSMVIVGSLLIGLGSAVRRSA